MLLLVDLDGVVYRGAEPMPGVAAVLTARVAAGDDVVYVTNNSMWYRADYLTRLTSMGAPVSPDRIVSSARATALYLAEQSPRPACALVVGGAGLVHELRDVGIEVMLAADAAASWSANGRDAAAATRGVDTVVVGLDLEFTYARLAVAAEAVRAGARFVATNRDPIYPLERGLMPGAGSMVAAVAAASGVEPVSIGKPGPLLLEVAAHAMGRPVTEAVMIGDSLVTDIPAAIAVGARSILMLTGISTGAELAALPPDQRPTEVAANAAELAAALDRLARPASA
ncbi:MAG: HAD-IIA family hydrolase [Candidatus Limnocylindrales bacterium]|jgi:HAD superfamily hydrolase (TIGR01450 family)